MTKSLDIGCGASPKNIFNADEVFGLDIREDLAANIYRADLVVDKIPFPDSTFDFVTAHDFLEHVPRIVYIPERKNAFVEVMNEIWRVLKDGGQFLSFTPAFPHAAAFRDPTHVNIITEETFSFYFDSVNRWAAGYGFRGAFNVVQQEWRGAHLLTVLQKVVLPSAIEEKKEAAIAESKNQDPRNPTMNEIHEEHWNTFLQDDKQRSFYEAWWHKDRIGFWRAERLLAPVLEVLASTKNSSWLTIGDGAGTDAWILHEAGFENVLATDLDDTVLKETHRRGYIRCYQTANAEKLDFPDNSFDYIVCKEALHHMSRPYMAIYEMLRVARYGVAIVEPQDPWGDWPCRTDPTQPHYESVGNYVYQFSFRELEKIGFGENLPGLFLKNLVDVYIEGSEFVSRTDDQPLWLEIRDKLNQSNNSVAAGTAKPNYVQAVIVKKEPFDGFLEGLIKSSTNWRFVRTDANPYLTST